MNRRALASGLIRQPGFQTSRILAHPYSMCPHAQQAQSRNAANRVYGVPPVREAPARLIRQFCIAGTLTFFLRADRSIMAS